MQGVFSLNESPLSGKNRGLSHYTHKSIWLMRLYSLRSIRSFSMLNFFSKSET